MLTYKINCVKYCSHKEYGIDAFHENNLIKSFEGITDNKSDMLKLTELCNELKLELCHIEDIIEDYLTDFTI